MEITLCVLSLFFPLFLERSFRMFKRHLIAVISLLCAAGLCFGTATIALAKVGISGGDPGIAATQPSDYIRELGDAMPDIPPSMLDNPDQGMSSAGEESAPLSGISSTVCLSSSSPSSAPGSSSAGSSAPASSSQGGSLSAVSSKTPGNSSSKAPAASSKPSAPSSSSKPSTSGGEMLEVTIGGTVQRLPAADVLSRVVMNEMSSSFETEALKAQAVAAHTYIKYYNKLGKAPSVGSRTPTAKVINAVKAVQDKMVYYNGSPINAVYCASVVGRTNSAADVWGGSIPYLVSVESPYDSGTPGWKGKTTYSVSEFQSLVKQKTGIALTGDPAGWLKVTSRTSGGYVGNITLGGKTSFGSTRLTGRVMRETITGFQLRSAKFDYAVSGETITFTTYGYGHGAGMSQHGANEYAKRGWTYDKILTHYYTGTVVK